MSDDLCGKPAVAVYVWPTMDRLVVCEDCAAKARGLASIMGFRLGVLNPPAPEATCEQRVKP
jgi:hypothetical protein